MTPLTHGVPPIVLCPCCSACKILTHDHMYHMLTGGVLMRLNSKRVGVNNRTSRAQQPPCPRLGVMGCAASPASVRQPRPHVSPGAVHLRTVGCIMPEIHKNHPYALGLVSFAVNAIIRGVDTGMQMSRQASCCHRLTGFPRDRVLGLQAFACW